MENVTDRTSPCGRLSALSLRIQGAAKVRKEPVRFDSFRLRTCSRIHRFISVRKLFFPGSTRFGLRFSDASWLGPVRFASSIQFPEVSLSGFRVRFRPIPELTGSVRFGRFGSVSYSFLKIGGHLAHVLLRHVIGPVRYRRGRKGKLKCWKQSLACYRPLVPPSKTSLAVVVR